VIPVKERVTFLLLTLLLASLVLFSGCFSKVKEFDEISGPTWVTSLTMPLIARIEEEGYEIRLGDAPNAQGGAGLGLAGKSLYSYRLESDEGLSSWSDMLETVEVELGTIASIPLIGPGTAEPPDGTGTEVELTNPDLAGVRLSDAYEEGVTNDITITIINGRAGADGLRFALVNYDPGSGVLGDEIIPAIEMSEGDTTGHIELRGATIPLYMYITVEGTVDTTEADAWITFTGSTMEIAAVTVDKDKLAELYELEETIDLGEVDLGEDLPEITLKTASLELEYDFPDNLQITATLKVEGKDNSGLIIGSRDLAITIPGTEPQIEFKDELNDILGLRPSSLVFSFTDLQFSSITGDTVEIELGREMSLGVIPEIGIATVITEPKEMDVPEEVKDKPLQAAMLYMIVNNTSPAGFDLTVYLSPELVPVNDEDAVKIRISIAPAEGGEPGVFDNTDDPIILTTAQLAYLTNDDRFYNQIEFGNQSVPGEITDEDYLEIHAWAQVDVLLNKKEEEAD